MMFRYFPGRMMGGGLFGLILTVLVVVGIVLLIVVLASRKNKTPVAAAAQGAAPAAQDRDHAVLLQVRIARPAVGAAAPCDRQRLPLGLRQVMLDLRHSPLAAPGVGGGAAATGHGTSLRPPPPGPYSASSVSIWPTARVMPSSIPIALTFANSSGES